MLIQKHQNSWVNDFNDLKKILEKTIPLDDIIIEHIGSTSVKDLAAKPIIDIDIVYNKTESFEAIKLSLEKLNYYHKGDQGIPGREVFKRKESEDPHGVLDVIAHHLYVCHIDSKELRRHLAFRDYLRENEVARREYENLKYAIAEKTKQNRKEYAKQKEIMAKDFIESIIHHVENMK